MSDADIDELLGNPPKRGRGRPLKEDQPTYKPPTENELRLAAVGRGPLGDPYKLLKPVTVSWLASAFRMDPQTIKKRLARCNPIAQSGQRNLYDFVDAAAYLVNPKIDLAAYIASIDTKKLPNHINKVYWEAQNARLRYELKAGDAWATEDVLEVFGEVFLSLKDQMQLWADNLHEASSLTDEQRALVRAMVDQLQTDMHSKLVEMPKLRKTFSRAVDKVSDDEELPEFDDDDGLLE